jgi:hypothetical protein
MASRYIKQFIVGIETLIGPGVDINGDNGIKIGTQTSRQLIVGLLEISP